MALFGGLFYEAQLNPGLLLLVESSCLPSVLALGEDLYVIRYVESAYQVMNQGDDVIDLVLHTSIER
jgi:hypothetical protein